MMRKEEKKGKSKGERHPVSSTTQLSSIPHFWCPPHPFRVLIITWHCLVGRVKIFRPPLPSRLALSNDGTVECFSIGIYHKESFSSSSFMFFALDFLFYLCFFPPAVATWRKRKAPPRICIPTEFFPLKIQKKRNRIIRLRSFFCSAGLNILYHRPSKSNYYFVSGETKCERLNKTAPRRPLGLWEVFVP